MITLPEALLPCPSCDGDNPVLVHCNGIYVKCRVCLMRGPVYDRASATRRWNDLPRRPKPLPNPTRIFTRKG